jgi:prepilin-type N-terminal cleavage/methylation domain-containing protein
VKRAFTLIEMLVVISIVAVLAAILFPVFAKVKASAQSTASVSNLSQIGKAFLLYTSDNNDRTPYVGYIKYFVELERGGLQIEFNPNYVGQTDLKRLLSPLLRSEEIWKSPADPGDSGFGSSYEYSGSSYDVWPHFCSGTLISLRNPSESAFVREVIPFKNNMRGVWRADGSAKLLPSDKAQDQLDATVIDYGCN